MVPLWKREAATWRTWLCSGELEQETKWCALPESVKEQAFHLYKLCKERIWYFPIVLLDVHSAVEQKDFNVSQSGTGGIDLFSIIFEKDWKADGRN